MLFPPQLYWQRERQREFSVFTNEQYRVYPQSWSSCTPFSCVQCFEISKILDWSLIIQFQSLCIVRSSFHMPNQGLWKCLELGSLFSLWTFMVLFIPRLHCFVPDLSKFSFRNCIFYNGFMTAYFPKQKCPGFFPQLPAEYGVSKGMCLQYCMKMFLVPPQHQPRSRIPSEGWSHPINLCKTIATNKVWCILGCILKDS